MKKILSLSLIVIIVLSILSVFPINAATHIYTVAGDEVLCGTKWDENNSDNDMTSVDDGIYEKEYKDIPSGTYEIKVVEDNSWSVNFSRKDSHGYPNVRFNVEEDNSTVLVRLTITGIDHLYYTEGYVEVFVNGEVAEEPPAPSIEEHYLAGESALCNGVEWDPKAEINKMTLNEDGTYSITVFNIPVGEYQFKITTNGTWEPSYGYNGLISPGAANQRIKIDEDCSSVTFTLGSNHIVTAVINAVVKEPIKWSYDEGTETLTVSGEGNIPDYDNDDAPWKEIKDIKHVIIEEGITGIGNNAFAYKGLIEDVSFPSTIKNIGEFAFLSCVNLKTITFTGNLECIYDGAFQHCKKLTKINFPDQVDKIKSYCFWGCTSLEVFTMPKNIKSSGNMFLANCPNLKSIEVPEGGNTKVVDGALLYSNGKTLVFYPPARKETTFVVPETVTKISKAAFYENQNLKTITILDNVETFGQSVFCEAKSLTNIIVSETNPYFSSANGVIFNKDKTTLFLYPSAKTNTYYEVPNTVEIIAEDSFINSENLKEITLQTGLQSIKGCAFEGCTNIKKMIIPETVEEIATHAIGYGKDDLGYPKIEGFTIYGAKGSYAETYANEKGFSFEETKIEKLTQIISGPKELYSKTYGDKAFSVESTTTGDGNITYSSSNNSIATVSKSGLVTIKKSGVVYISVQASETRKYDENEFVVEVIIKKKTQKLTGLRSSYKTVYGSKSFKLRAKASSKLNYKSTNKKVATVNSKGKVNIKGYGQTKIIVSSCNDGKYVSVKKTAILTVVPQKIKKINVTHKSSSKSKRFFSWNYKSKVNGFEFQYSKNKNFKGKVTFNLSSKTFGVSTRFNKGYYYIRVRSYKKASGKKYFSDWKTIGIRIG